MRVLSLEKEQENYRFKALFDKFSPSKFTDLIRGYRSEQIKKYSIPV